jgi:hypothetical protein
VGVVHVASTVFGCGLRDRAAEDGVDCNVGPKSGYPIVSIVSVVDLIPKFIDEVNARRRIYVVEPLREPEHRSSDVIVVFEEVAPGFGNEVRCDQIKK